MTWSTVVAVVVVYYGTLVFYRLFLHPLARFPDGKYTSKIRQLHVKYGPIIRISPYELHVADPAFYDSLYRMGGRWDKYAWTYDAFGARRSTVFGSDHYDHKIRRGAIASFFSKPRVAAQENILRRNVDKLCQRISELSGSTFNLGAAISAFTRDTASEFIVRRRYNELDLEDFGVGLSQASQGAGPFWRIKKHVRWFGPAMRALPVSWAIKIADEGTRAFLHFLQQSDKDTRETLAAAESSAPQSRHQSTMIHEIVYSDLLPVERTFDHLERLPYITAVLMEGLRLGPGVATRAARVTDKDLSYDNWRIPAGTPVGMTIILMHTDEKMFPDPMCFFPDRWMELTALAWAEMYLLLSTSVQKFDLTFKDAVAKDFQFEKDNFGIGTKAGCNLLAQATYYKTG
ncbi:trichodiene oxygenase [Xylaria sp. FL0064]|nr:trichodiene oxygenase [Xylaria sp. FL0064]